MITDAIRAKCLEASGYQVTVAEFVGGEHTAKNVMIAAVKTGEKKKKKEKEKQKESALAELRALVSAYNIHSHHLVSLLDFEDVLVEGGSPVRNKSLRPRLKSTRKKDSAA
tara:strand:- start:126 stop:458 length:333 start_codon:yes stop_codon:yes gene_type:complete